MKLRMTIEEFEAALRTDNRYASLTLIGGERVIGYCAMLGQREFSDVEPTREAVVALHNDLAARRDEFVNVIQIGLDARNRNASLTGKPVVATISLCRSLDLDTQLII